MNRSILIVICDFLVLSALSLSSGSVETSERFQGQSKTGTAKRDLYVEEIEQAVIEKGDELAKLHDRLKAVSDEKMQFSQNLDEKVKELQAAEKQLAERAKDLEEKTKLLAQQEKSLAEKENKIQNLSTSLKNEEKVQQDNKTALLNLQDSYRAVQNKLKQTEQTLAETSKKAKESGENLDKQRQEVVQQWKVLEKWQRQSQDDAEKLRKLQDDLNFAENEINYYMGRLDGAERQREDAEKRLAVSENNLRRAEGQLGTAEGQLSEARNMNFKTQQELNSSRENLKKTQIALARSNEKSRQMNKQLVDMEKKLNSNALSSYSKAVSDLHVHVEVSRFPAPLVKDSHYYSPYVKIHDKFYLVQDTKSVLGADVKNFSWNNVKNLYFSFSDYAKNGSKSVLKMPFLVSRKDPRIILIPLDCVAGTALNTISFESLKKRGTQNLTLFKSSSLESNYADLEGRCSLCLSGADKGYLLIRNSSRSSSELEAEPGDFVISKEGECVGVIVEVRSSDFGQKREAVCCLLPEPFKPADFYELRITKKDTDESYSDFAADIKSIQSEISSVSKK